VGGVSCSTAASILSRVWLTLDIVVVVVLLLL
jgi:hypothetical protein